MLDSLYTAMTAGRSNGYQYTLAQAYLRFSEDRMKDEGYFAEDTAVHRRVLPYLDRALTLVEDYAEAYSARGAARSRLGQYAAAAQDYAQYIRLRPYDPTGYGGRGHCYYDMERFDAACADFKRRAELMAPYIDATYDKLCGARGYR